jgi:hypothetical protein
VLPLSPAAILLPILPQTGFLTGMGACEDAAPGLP